jgi:hypothetical protein
MVIYKIFVFGTDRKSNMATRAHNVTTQWSFLQSHNSIGLVVSDKKIFKISANENTLWTLGESFADRKFKMATMTRLSLTLDPMGISHFHLFFWNHKTDLNQTWLDIIYYMLCKCKILYVLLEIANKWNSTLNFTFYSSTTLFSKTWASMTYSFTGTETHVLNIQYSWHIITYSAWMDSWWNFTTKRMV